jgi:hypothetical protein
MENMKNAHRILFGKYEGKRLLGGPTNNGRIILKCLLKK